MAEYYHIYNWREYPLNYVATLALGLSDDSRTKRAITGAQLDLKTTLLAAIIDRLSILCWQNTEDARKGRNKPKSVLDELLKEPSGAKQKYKTFASGAEFKTAWRALVNKEN